MTIPSKPFIDGGRILETSQAQTVEDLPEQFNAAEDLILANRVSSRSGKVAIVDDRGETTYEELAVQINRMANGLRSIGARRGDRVLLCLQDSVQFPIAFLGAIKAGITPVPLNTMLKTEEYRWILNDSHATAVVVDVELSDTWREIAAECSAVKFLSTTNRGPWASLREVLAGAGAQAEPADTHRDEPAFWLYTSGSTGRPKGVMHAHGSMRLSANLFGRGIAGYREDDVVFSVSKLFFAYGLGNALSFPFSVGATAILRKDRPTPESVSRLIQENRITVLSGVPTFYAGWLASEHAPTRTSARSLRLAVSAGEPLPAHIGRRFQEAVGFDIVDGLGSTEMLHIYLSQRPGNVKYGCTGKPVPGYEARVLLNDGSPASAGEIGELHVKGPTAAIGYWRNGPKTRRTFLGEWTRTGDTYSCDDEGWFTYSGRSDEMLKVGGIYVSPTEVEEAIAAHEAVLEAAVVGGTDKDGLVKPHAYVVLKPGASKDVLTDDHLRQYLRQRLAPYKIPRQIEFIGELPRTPTGKVQRYKLRQSL